MREMVTIVKGMLKSARQEDDQTFPSSIRLDEEITKSKEVPEPWDTLVHFDYLCESLRIILNIIRHIQIGSGPLFCSAMRFGPRESNV